MVPLYQDEQHQRKVTCLLVTTQLTLSEACEWLDKNLESMFTKYIPTYGKFETIRVTHSPRVQTNHNSATNSEWMPKTFAKPIK